MSSALDNPIRSSWYLGKSPEHYPWMMREQVVSDSSYTHNTLDYTNPLDLPESINQQFLGPRHNIINNRQNLPFIRSNDMIGFNIELFQASRQSNFISIVSKQVLGESPSKSPR